MIRRPSSAFTLIEMLMVMVIIAIIASLIVGIAGYANKRSARSRTLGEIHAMSVACENFKADNGSVPREADKTEAKTLDGDPPISAIKHGNPDATNYKVSSLFLYQALSGDDNLDGRGGDPDPLTQKPRTEYHQFTKGTLARITTTNPPGPVLYLQDPFGHSYGYSTSKAMAEAGYAQQAKTSIKKDTEVARQLGEEGFNSTFDLWSTAGATKDPPDDSVRMKWEKNW